MEGVGGERERQAIFSTRHCWAWPRLWTRGSSPRETNKRSTMSGVQHQARVDSGIDREWIIATLRAHQPELRRRGVRHAALFGSLARCEGKRTSDIDILIELDPEAPVGLFEYVGITQYLTDLFPVRVDIANRSSLKPLVRPSVEHDALYAF
jgi:predicted nucleotidyltransferase